MSKIHGCEELCNVSFSVVGEKDDLEKIVAVGMESRSECHLMPQFLHTLPLVNKPNQPLRTKKKKGYGDIL